MPIIYLTILLSGDKWIGAHRDNLDSLAHKESSPILHEAFGALTSLAGDHDNKMRIQDSDGVEMIVGVMWVQ